MSSLIIGTAGHIDHGKTSLIRALTGHDLDRLPEERARGITIALGFTHLELPGRRLSFVDVPGHEALVRTMISGASGLDAALLCVSAPDGVMPQTREHLSILGLLDVRCGVIAITKVDAVDEELLELAQLDVEEAVAGTFLEDAPVICTAATDPPQGLDALREALCALPVADRDAAGPFRLPIDRAFIRRGFGTVVTGTLRGGSVRDGDEVRILPLGLRSRVRGVQVHGEKVREATAGTRTAINLAGVERDDLARGMVVVHPGALEPASILDVRYRHLSSAPPLPHGGRVRLLIGTSEVMAVVSLIAVGDLTPDTADGSPDEAGVTITDADELTSGEAAFLQLRTDTPILALAGDRFIVRRESPVTTLGGGTVLDPWAPRVRRRDHARAAEALARLDAGDRRVYLERAGDRGLSPERAALLNVTGGCMLGEALRHPDRLAQLEETLVGALAEWHRGHPLASGAPRRELHRARLPHLSERAFDDLVAGLARSGRLVLTGPRVRTADFRIQLDAAQRERRDDLIARCAAAGLEGVPASGELSTRGDLVTYLLDRGTLIRVGARLVRADALVGLQRKVAALIRSEGGLRPADFKQLTGLSRKFAIPLLEWLDASGLTIRRGDCRILAPGASPGIMRLQNPSKRAP